MTTEEWNKYFYGHWNFPGARQDEHLAMFPEELPRRLIKMFSFAGETVLDPFLGSGTTSLAAMHLGRNSVGIEKNPAFVDVIRKKLGAEQSDMLNPCEIEYATASPLEDNEIAALLERQPYLFRDPIALSLQTDPRAKTYGSVIGVEGNEEGQAAQAACHGVGERD
jgi:hypothetical protein